MPYPVATKFPFKTVYLTKIDQKEKLSNTMIISFMATAKQIAWRKKFARMSKAGAFKKKQSQSKSAKNPKTIGAKKNHKSSKSKLKLPNGQGIFLVSDMPNPEAFSKKYLVVGIKRKGSREAWLVPKKQFNDFEEARQYEKKLDYGYSVHDDPAYSNSSIDQEAVAEFLHGTKDDYF